MPARLAILAVVLTAAWTLALGFALSTSAHAHTRDARPVTLSMARVEPTWLVLVPGMDVRHGRVRFHRVTHAATPCPHGGYFSDVSAYRWNGSALGGQHETRMRVSWRDTREGGRVVWDGVTFTNRTTRAVLVAGWGG